jgi:3'(2'), 5'-bisphosphate nucleotidase
VPRIQVVTRSEASDDPASTLSRFLVSNAHSENTMSPVDHESADLLRRTLVIARQAGELVLEVYGRHVAARAKADDSPVTEADERAEELIVTALSGLGRDVPIVAEEAVAAGRTPRVGDVFWLVVPLDGTKEFVSRNGEFTVNIALVQSQQPVLGVVYAPALGTLYAGTRRHGAFVEERGERRGIVTRPVPEAGLTVVGSRSHGDADAMASFLAGRKVADTKQAGSSLKFCLVAEGAADLYPRFGRTMEWDTAAGHAVLLAAGGRVDTLAGTPLRYGKPGFENPHFVASGTVPREAPVR